MPGERLQIVLNRASEFGVLSTAQIERVLGFNIAFSVNSDYRTVASAVNSGVPVSTLRASEINGAARRDRAGDRRVSASEPAESGVRIRGAGGLDVAPRCDSGASQ